MSDINAQVAQKLSDLGYGPAATDAAIRKFQADHHLAIDGIVGPQTLKALGITISAQMILPPYNPTLTSAEAAQAIRDGYTKVVGSAPSVAILGLLMGQSALETANWQRMPNFNFGGIKATPGDAYVQIFRTTEVVGGVTVPMDQTFAAYKTAANGAAAYVHQIHARANWWAGLQTGTPEGFIQGLTTPPAYFTANPDQYLAGLKTRLAAFSAVASEYAVA